MRALVPDLRAIVEEYIGGRSLGVWYDQEQRNASDDPARRLMVRLHTHLESGPRGLRQKLYSGFGNFQIHKWMYDGASLAKLLLEAGFVGVQESRLHESAIPHIEKVEMRHRVENGAGVIVEGIKPA